MKRLVTQFDRRRTRATVATPTCCCCCCCCVGSILTATGVTTIDAQHVAGRAGLPAGRRWLYGLAGFLALPLALLAATIAGSFASLIDEGLGFLASVVAFFAAWIGVLLGIYRSVEPPKRARAVGITVVCCTFMFGAELAAGIGLIFSGDYGWIVYLALAFTLPFALVPLLLKWIRS